MPKPIEIKFNYSKTMGNLAPNLLNLSYFESSFLLTKAGQDQLTFIKKAQPSLKYLRILNIFTSNPSNFSNLDKVFDSLTSLGFIPYVVLGFMPKELSSAPPTQENPQYCPPREYSAWQKLITATISHFLGRYGDSAIKTQWYFELWNEPNLPVSWHGTLADYCKLYDFTLAGLMDAILDGKFRFGGPAVSETDYAFLRGFIEHCLYDKNAVTGKIGSRVDFLSFHVNGEWNWPTPSVKIILKSILSFEGILDYYKPHPDDRPDIVTLPQDIEVHITALDPFKPWKPSETESLSIHPKYNFVNTEYYAAFLSYIGTMVEWIRLNNQVNISLVFSDYLSPIHEKEKPFEFTPNIITIREDQTLQSKPVGNAYDLMNRVEEYPDRLELEGKAFIHRSHVNSIASKNKNKVRIILTHFTPQFESAEMKHICLSLMNLPLSSQKAKIHEFRINSNKNQTEKNSRTIDIGGSELVFEMELLPWDICFYEIEFE